VTRDLLPIEGADIRFVKAMRPVHEQIVRRRGGKNVSDRRWRRSRRASSMTPASSTS
jgi:hypothetical protein